MASRPWTRLLGSIGLLASLTLVSMAASARPVTGTTAGNGGADACVGGAYFCSFGVTGVESVAACEAITNRDLACFDLMRLVHSDAAASGAQQAFRSEPLISGTVGGFNLPTSATGESLRLVATTVGPGPMTGPRGETIDVGYEGTVVTLELQNPLESPLLLALQTAQDEVAYLLLDGKTAFESGRLALDLSSLQRGYYGLSLYEGTFRRQAEPVSAPGSLLLAALALGVAAAVARRR